MPTNKTNIAIAILRKIPSIWTANNAPANAPSIIPDATGFRWLKSMDFFFLWAFADAKPVKIMHEMFHALSSLV